MISTPCLSPTLPMTLPTNMLKLEENSPSMQSPPWVENIRRAFWTRGVGGNREESEEEEERGEVYCFRRDS